MLGSARPRAVSAAGLILWTGLALLVLAGAIYAPDPSLARTTVVNWWALVFVPLLAGALRVASDPRYIRQFLWVIFGTSVFNVALGLTMLSSTERLVLLGNNTIGVSRAAVLVPLLAATFVLAQVGKIWRVAVVAAIPAAFVVALASGSRGPVLVLGAMGIAAGIRAFARPQTRDWRIPAAAGAAVVAVVLVTSSISSYLPGLSVQRFELFEELLQSGVSGEVNTSVGDTSSGIRLQMFGLAADLFVERPVLGVGTAGFAAVSPLYLSTREGEAYPHNTVLQFAAEFGLVGLVIYLALIVLALVRRLPSGPEYTSLRALFIFFFLNAMVSGDIYTDRQTWALLLLILLADLRVPSRVNAIVPGHDRRLMPAFARARS
jgi:O-antigen ligase